jgi:hypothetical protein
MLDVSVATEVIVTLFPEIYLRFHVRRSKRGRRLDTTATAVLTHLDSAGPLTIGEAARHLKRSQSVISEIVSRPAACRSRLARTVSTAWTPRARCSRSTNDSPE